MSVVRYLSDYLSRVAAPKAIRDSLKSNWKVGVKNRLAESEGKRFIERRMILQNTRIKLEWSDESRHLYNQSESLWLASAVPAWRQGWSKHIKNEKTRELISDYFHFLTQFWHRCNATPVLVYIAYKYDELAVWVGASQVHAQPISDEQFKINKKEKRITAFLRQVNCHHPVVHNACYHYLRMRQLLSYDFIEDAFVNMDSIASLARRRNLELGGSKTDLTRLNLSPTQLEMAEFLHRLRGEFAAHPSMTKWWDFSEIFSDELERLTPFALTLILQIAKSYVTENCVEQTYSGITNASSEFHDCFWFNRLPALAKS